MSNYTCFSECASVIKDQSNMADMSVMRNVKNVVKGIVSDSNKIFL